VSKWEWFKDEKRGSLSSLQKKPQFLKTLAMGKYPFALIIFVFVLKNRMEINISMYVLWVALFVISLDFFLSDEEKKREAIDLGYWILPLTLVGIEHVNGF
jgi:hypothetical protein